MEKPGSLPTLEGLSLPKERDEAAEKVAWVYNIATKLQHGALQNLAANKLRALYPISPLRILIVAKIVEPRHETEQAPRDPIRQLIVGLVVEHYFLLMEEHGSQLSRLLQGDRALGLAVHGKLAGGADAGM